MAHLDEGLDLGLASRALGHDQDPDGFDGTVSGLRASGGPATEGGPSGFDGVERIGLAAAASFVEVGEITSMTLIPARRKCRANPAPYEPVP